MAIEPSGAQVKTATTNEPVEWEWTITPKSAGQKTMIIEVAANIEAGIEKHKVKAKTLREAIVIQVSIFQQMQLYAATVSGYVVAVSASITAIAGLIGFVPPVRNFVLAFLARRRRPERYGR